MLKEIRFHQHAESQHQLQYAWKTPVAASVAWIANRKDRAGSTALKTKGSVNYIKSLVILSQITAVRVPRGNDARLCTIRSTGTNTVLRPGESREGDGREKNRSPQCEHRDKEIFFFLEFGRKCSVARS